MDKKLRVGILGATGMVGQRFIALLENHPWYEKMLPIFHSSLLDHSAILLRREDNFSLFCL